MGSLRCARHFAQALLVLLAACSNGRGSLDGPGSPSTPPTQGAQDGYSVGGTVSGLAGSGLILQNNGGGDLTIAADGAFTFTGRSAAGAAYSVTVLSQPTGPSQTCAVSNGSGSIASANVTNIAVTCATGQFSVGGNVSGLTGTGLVLQNNGGDDVAVTANGGFAFANRLVNGATYNVTVKSQSSGQSCVVRNASGTIAGANISNVEVSCASDQFTVGGTVTGLAGSGLILQLNGGNDLAIVSNGGFAFEVGVPNNTAYQVRVRTLPSNPAQSCTVTNGSGSVTGSNVTNVAVTCTSSSFSVGGSVSGLAGSGLALQLNDGPALEVASNGNFTFDERLVSGTSYRVTVSTHPSNPTQVCTVAAGSGTIGNGNVTSVRVTCASNTYSIGGTVNGLMGSGLVLQNNRGDDLAVNSNGAFSFRTALASGARYDVRVRTQPSNPAQSCSVTNGQGTVDTTEVSNVVVSCSTSDFTIGGTVSGLSGSGLILRNNGGDELTIDDNGSYTFNTGLPIGARYNVTIAQQPTNPGQSCTVSNGTGLVLLGNVTNVTVRCATEGFLIGVRVRSLRGSGLVLQNNGGDDLAIASSGRYEFSTPLPSGAFYNVTVARQPSSPQQTCSVRDGSGAVGDSDVRNVEVRCQDGNGD
jgi:hypothetical protein